MACMVLALGFRVALGSRVPVVGFQARGFLNPTGSFWQGIGGGLVEH